VHLHDGKLHDDGRITLVPAGRGDVDVKRAIELLERADYAGFVSGEWIGWEPAEVHLPRELAAVKGWLRAKPAS
jgi:sugar phosphate isomerase/epimerase